MFNNTALDVFIGLIFVFLLYSLLATIVQEMIAVRLAFRSKVLEKAILRMLEDGRTTTPIPYVDRLKGVLHLFGLINQLKNKTVAPWFYAHPLIKYLAEDNYYSKPAYLDATNFSKVMIDLLKGFSQSQSATQAIHNAVMAGVINKLPINISSTTADKANPAVKVLQQQNPTLPDPATLAMQTVPININTALFLRSLWQESGADINLFRVKLEDWFDDTMERATGWYKRYTRFVLFLLGIIIAVVFNVDAIAIHRILSKDKGAREQLVQMAIANTGKYDMLTHTPLNDSLLNQTYHMVLSDAGAANEVIGLGRPWQDSCKLCEAFKEEPQSKLYLARLDSFSTARNNILSAQQQSLQLQNRIDSLTRKKDSIQAQNKRTDSAAIRRLTIQINTLASTKQSVDAGLAKQRTPALTDSINRMTVLSQRCPYILQQTNNTWFKYSPNQNGGLETLLGWCITALAISLGAPFWFDLLNKIVKLRGSGTKITTTDADASTNIKLTHATVAAPTNLHVNPIAGEEAVG